MSRLPDGELRDYPSPVQRYPRQMQDAGIDITSDEHSRYRIGERTRLPPLQFTSSVSAG